MGAKIIVHDGLVDPSILSMAQPTARLVSVAKSRSRHTMPQEEINALLVREALAGNDVVRQWLPGVKFEDPLCSLREEGGAGRVAFMNAIS